MKMSSDLRNIKRELILNFNINLIEKGPNKDTLEQNWKEIILSIEEILNNGKCHKCYQELYMNINDLLLYDIPTEIIEEMSKKLKVYAYKILDTFQEICQKDNFFEHYNPVWQTVIEKFNLLKKILNKFEKKAYGNFQKSNIHSICKLVDYLYIMIHSFG